jgi:hypothetical protein
MSAMLRLGLVLAMSFVCNGDAELVRECVQDCGPFGVRVIVTDDWESEGIYCSCDDWKR